MGKESAKQTPGPHPARPPQASKPRQGRQTFATGGGPPQADRNPWIQARNPLRAPAGAAGRHGLFGLLGAAAPLLGPTLRKFVLVCFSYV